MKSLPLRTLTAPLLAAALVAAPARAQAQVPAPAPSAGSAYAADTPSDRRLYEDGPDGRFLMGGTWLFRLDRDEVGLRQGFQRQASTAGWTRVTVPNAWNAADESAESMMGTVGWYRKDFRLPQASARLAWVVRFESVNYRSRVWLNGRPIGSNTGAYLPFELRLPGLRRRGVNRLVIRVDNRRYPTDFPPSGLTQRGVPTGGWWNYGGLLREVYLRRIDRVDFTTVQVRPELPCAACDATVDVRVTVRNYAERPLRIALSGRYGDRLLRFPVAAVGAKRFHTFRARFAVKDPRLWSPERPSLYRVAFDARASGGRGGRLTRAARYRLRSGIRSIKVTSDGRLVLNGRLVNFRGVGLHEDDPKLGFAVDNRVREQLVTAAKDLGATLIRAHYPLHPYTHELADRLGLLIWSEIPVYAVKTRYLKQPLVRKLAARELRDNILINQNHPSVLLWSVGNELSSRPGPVQGFYIARAARTARALDPTRPVGIAVAGYPGAGCQDEYAPLDVIGINDYFGWYPGPNGQIADRTLLPAYLDSVRACYPTKALVVSEFGAEANRDGPVEEKGTWAFQQDFIAYHLGVYATKPWLSGSIYWALKEFRVRPDWDGGNPRPRPPIHQKGLIAFDGRRKPAFFDVQRIFRGTLQYRPLRRGPRRR